MIDHDRYELRVIFTPRPPRAVQKRRSAIRWCRAVNYHGGYGRWLYKQTRKPGDLRARLKEFRELADEAVRSGQAIS